MFILCSVDTSVNVRPTLTGQFQGIDFGSQCPNIIYIKRHFMRKDVKMYLVFFNQQNIGRYNFFVVQVSNLVQSFGKFNFEVDNRLEL
jgi:hypothetical protein